MKSVLFTPGGSGMAVTGIKALSDREDIRTVATDIDELSPGLHLADTGYLVPEFDDPEYMNSIFDIIQQENIDVVIPALDPILKRFAKEKSELEENGAKVMISPYKTLGITQDKWKTYQKLADTIPMPDSWIDIDNLEDDGDYFVKPREGSGSKGAHRVTSQSELEFYCERVTEPIIQSYLPGEEYTIDCLTDKDGDVLACVPRLRKEITSGISTKVAVVEKQELFDLARNVAEELTFTGPFFIQAKVDKNGVARVTEIGARTAGTMCGEFVSPSLQYLSILQLCGEPLPEPTVNFGSQISRYWAEQYFDNGFDSLHRW